MQTKTQSFIEISANTAVGFIISYASTFIIFPFVGFESSNSQSFIVTLFFTVVSLLRGFVIRRIFNKKSNNGEFKCSHNVYCSFQSKPINCLSADRCSYKTEA